jgi:hypothetical protein
MRHSHELVLDRRCGKAGEAGSPNRNLLVRLTRPPVAERSALRHLGMVRDLDLALRMSSVPLIRSLVLYLSCGSGGKRVEMRWKNRETDYFMHMAQRFTAWTHIAINIGWSWQLAVYNATERQSFELCGTGMSFGVRGGRMISDELNGVQTPSDTRAQAPPAMNTKAIEITTCPAQSLVYPQAKMRSLRLRW